MSQNSLILPTTGTVSGLSMTQDANAALDTLNTLASGATAPSSPEAGQLWHDTTTNTIRILSDDGTTWIFLFNLNQSAYTATPYVGGPLGQCKFEYSTSTQAILLPYNGNKVIFPNGAVATIPSGGITSTITSCYLNGTASSSLSAGLYYAYLWNNGSTYVIDFSATAYATDSTSGITVKSGDGTRVHIGMAQVAAGPLLTYTASAKLVRSWFNDNGISTVNNFSTTRTTASGSTGEINTEIRNQLLLYAGESVMATICGTVSNGTAGDGVLTGIGLNGASAQNGNSSMVSSSGGFQQPAVASICTNSLSEGFNYATLVGNIITGGTATWQAETSLSVITRR